MNASPERATETTPRYTARWLVSSARVRPHRLRTLTTLCTTVEERPFRATLTTHPTRPLGLWSFFPGPKTKSRVPKFSRFSGSPTRVPFACWGGSGQSCSSLNATYSCWNVTFFAFRTRAISASARVHSGRCESRDNNSRLIKPHKIPVTALTDTAPQRVQS